jgi:hypothetical protein
VEAELSWLWLEEGGDTYLKAWKRMVGSEPNGTGLSANTQQLKNVCRMDAHAGLVDLIAGCRGLSPCLVLKIVCKM